MKEHAPFQPREVVILDECHNLAEYVQSHFSPRIDWTLVDEIRDVTEELRDAGIKLPYNTARWGMVSTATKNVMRAQYTKPHEIHLALLEYELQLVELLEKISMSKIIISSKYGINLTEDEDGVAISDYDINEAEKKIPGEIKNFLKHADLVKDIHCKVEDYNLIVKNGGVDGIVVEAGKGYRVFNYLYESYMVKKHFIPFADIRIYMSATVGDPDAFVKRHGINKDLMEFIKVDTGWDYTKSQILYMGSDNFKYANKNALSNSLGHFEKVLNNHKGERGVIHTTTYEIAKQLENKFDRIIAYKTADEKLELMAKIEELRDDRILAGPSLVEGVDLYDDLARFQILVKVPYPNLQSQLWRRRCYSKERWLFNYQTALWIEQAIGRGHRNRHDWCVTYLMDKRFLQFFTHKSKNRYLSKTLFERFGPKYLLK